MKMKKLLLTTATLAALMAPAYADMKILRRAVVNNWQLTAWSLESDPTSFSHCAAVTTASSNGVHLLFVISEETFSVGLFDTRWELNPWQTYDVTISIDNYAPLSAQSRAASQHQASIRLPKSEAFYLQLMRGKVLHVKTASKQFDLRLFNADKMLPALLACAKIESDVAGTSNNPFSGSSTDTAPGASTSVKGEEEAF
jgi:hypothetical protein